ncbi:hypothetical protein [Kutzneria sp. NPDC052558]|uniref:hypothetical protein n=1 Tax=Kutzneria sp. NPDC052558 TaxID=3364121 RepID=UPI0037CA3AAD
MSASFTIGFGRWPDAWDSTRGMLNWVETVVAEHTDDAALAAGLRELADCGYQFLSFHLIERDQVPELVQVVIDALMSAAEQEFHDRPEIVAHVQELVDFVTEWQVDHLEELLAWDHDAALAACRLSLTRGATVNDVLLRLRATGFSPADCVQALHTLTGRTLAEMADVIHRSDAWADCRRRQSGDLLREALDKGLADSTQPR